MRLFLVIVLVFAHSLEAHQGMAVLDEMYEIMEARGRGLSLAMRGGTCLLNESNWLGVLGHDVFVKEVVGKWAEINYYTEASPFVLLKGFYLHHEESAPRNTWGGLTLARSFRSVQSRGNPSRFSSFAQQSLARQGEQQDLLSFPGHENLE